jgi:hypothetical protein
MTATFHMCQLNGCVGMDRSITIENKIHGKTERTPCDHSLLDFQIFHLPDLLMAEIIAIQYIDG